MAEEDAMANELRHGLASLRSGALEGAQRFASGEGRHGSTRMYLGVRDAMRRTSRAGVQIKLQRRTSVAVGVTLVFFSRRSSKTKTSR